jgi:hypothetical protein
MSFRLILVVAPSFVRERLLCGTSVSPCYHIGNSAVFLDFAFRKPESMETLVEASSLTFMNVGI